MKTFTNMLALAVVVSVLVLSGCGKGDEPGPGDSESQRISKLLASGIWQMKSVTVDGTPQTEHFDGLTLSFTATGFTATFGDPVWPATGRWTFSDGTATSFTRNDDVVVSISNISETSLMLSLKWDKNTFGPGKASSIAGTYVFIFGK